jgi:hypothetical protein
VDVVPLVDVPLAVEVVLLDVWQDEDGPGDPAVDVDAARRQEAVGVVIAVDGDADLLEVVGAADACGGLAHLLDGREQEADQDGEDR